MMNFISTYNKRRITAIFTGINKLNKKCSISLSFSTLPLLYSTCNSVCQDPGRNKYRRFPPLLREPTHLRPAGQPAVPQSHKKLRFIREFWSLATGKLPARALVLPGTYPQVILRLYIQGSLGVCQTPPVIQLCIPLDLISSASSTMPLSSAIRPNLLALSVFSFIGGTTALQ